MRRMTVVMHTNYATPTARCGPDQTISLPRAEAEQLIAKGYASPVDAAEQRRRQTSGPPAGSAKQVLAWVDGDPARAAVALDAELARDKPRRSVVAALEEILDQADGGEETDDAPSA